MRLKSLIIVAAFTASFMLVGFVTSPAFAREVENATSDDSIKTALTTNTSTEDAKLKLQAEAQKKLEAAKLDAQKKLEAAKQKVQEQTEAQRQKLCQEKATQISQQITKKTADAKKHKQVFDKIYNRVKEFKQNNNLNPANYDALIANVDTKSANAQAAIDALSKVETNIDCTKLDTVKTNVATYIAALKQTIQALKEYRTSIKDLIVAVKNSIGDNLKTETETSENSTSTGSTN